jgi:hypothetical protein
LSSLLVLAACTGAPDNRVVPTPAGSGQIALDVSTLWRMSPREGAITRDGVIEDAGELEFGSDYPVDPGSYEVRLDARSLLTAYPSLGSFHWTFDGRDAGSSVTASVETTLGPHLVGLAVSGGGLAGSDLKSITVADRLIVSMGDSIASGEGNPDIPGHDGTGFGWENERCDRSGLAYGAVAARKLQDLQPQVSVTYASVACSGAGIGEQPGPPIYCSQDGLPVPGFENGTCITDAPGLLLPYIGMNPPPPPSPPAQPDPLKPQVDAVAALAGSRLIDDLVISVGGNDVAFSYIANRCAFPLHECNQQSDLTQMLAQHLDALGKPGGGYDQLAAAIKSKLNVRRVWITTVYDPTTNTDGSTCPSNTILADAGEFAHGNQVLGGQVSQAEASWVSRDLIGALNNVIVAAAARNGWRVLGSPTDGGTFAQLFSGHGYCSADPFVVKAKDSAQLEGPGIDGNGTTATKGTLHPNVEGTAVYANVMASRLSTGPTLTLTNGTAIVADCAGASGWLSGSRSLGASGCTPGAGFTVEASNPSRPGQPNETDGILVDHDPWNTPILTFDGAQVVFNRADPHKWTCASPSLTCEVDVPVTSGALPDRVTFSFTLNAEGRHTFDLVVGNGLGVTRELGWVSQTDWTPPQTGVSPVHSGGTVQIFAGDADSGVAATYNTVNGSSPSTGNSVTLRDGDVLEYWSTDVAGNIEAKHRVKLQGGVLVAA